jgi:S-DNA-T family DNA segregation ATPase FtsK/SpoIIIE
MEIVSVPDFEKIVQSFGIKARCADYKASGNYFYYDLELLSNAKVSSIKKYADEISLAIKSPCRPSIKVIHRDGLVRLEFVDVKPNKFNLFDYFTNRDIPDGKVNILLGQTVSGKRMWIDLDQEPHMLVAGTTGSGKSTLLNNIIANLFNYSDATIKLIDPKKIEFAEYERRCGIQVAYTYDDAYSMLEYLQEVMENRYDRIRNGESVNDMSPIVVIIDEFADLIIQDKDRVIHDMVCRLTQKCRSASMYFILATQRPSVNIVSGSIKANFPARIACRLPSHVDSKVILDTTGAENLLGGGDALIRDNIRDMERFQIAYTNAEEVANYFGDR